jgi:hypothetical protein
MLFVFKSTFFQISLVTYFITIFFIYAQNGIYDIKSELKDYEQRVLANELNIVSIKKFFVIRTKIIIHGVLDIYYSSFLLLLNFKKTRKACYVFFKVIAIYYKVGSIIILGITSFDDAEYANFKIATFYLSLAQLCLLIFYTAVTSCIDFKRD